MYYTCCYGLCDETWLSGPGFTYGPVAAFLKYKHNPLPKLELGVRVNGQLISRLNHKMLSYPEKPRYRCPNTHVQNKYGSKKFVYCQYIADVEISNSNFKVCYKKLPHHKSSHEHDDVNEAHWSRFH